ncbi:DNA-binding protein [Streptomyces sp. MMS24-I2-30]|uniref:DNA-binding protein n=1 Tax=Streptomyces sp. MMS24-I2-30 TaxID=3351564 RepID=UPI003896AB1F
MTQAGALRIAPLPAETTWSLMGRIAARYGMPVTGLRASWQWRNHPPHSPGTGGVRPDAEVLLDSAGQNLLAAMCRTDPRSLERALPAWTTGPAMFTEPSGDGRPQACWQLGALAHRPVAFACRLCTARRTGQQVVAMRYRDGWQRVCPRHRRWALGAGDGHGLEHLDLARIPAITSAQQRWPTVARRAAAAGVAPGAVFAVAQAVVCQWWDMALEWEEERVWPARLHQLAGGDAGPQFWWWRAVAREPAVFPEAVTLAEVLLDPVVVEMVWRDSGAERIRPFPPDGEFGRELGRRLGRPWLAHVGAVPDSSVLNRWWGAIVRRRRGVGVPGDRGLDPWWLPREDQPASVAAQLRTLAQRADGTITWRACIPRPERVWINDKVREATELLAALDLHDTAPLATATRHLLDTLSQSIDTLDHAVTAIASAAQSAGVPLDHLATWTHTAVEVLQQDIDDHRDDLEDRYGYRPGPVR